MTSVAIIAGQVSRFEHLKEQVKQSERQQNGAEKMQQNLETIKELLNAAHRDKRKKTAKFSGLEKEIVRLSYDIVQRMSLPRGKIELQDLEQKLDNLRQNLENEKGGLEQITESSTASETGEKEIRESSNDLLDRIKKELLQGPSQVLCILGESGMGKTTLANKLFHDDHSFEVYAWVSIHQNFQIKRVLLALVLQLGPQKSADIREMNEIELIAQIFAVLEEKRFLIVIDDIWEMEDWQSLRPALPVSTSGRVIITTSSEDVARVATPTKESIFKIPGFIQSDIINILKEEEAANFNPDSNVAETISEISGGSPLIATILGKSLLTKAANTTSKRELLQELESYKPQKGTPQVLGLSYERLSPVLKPFLLYLGQFQLGQDIEVDKLYTLLAADDLIMSPRDSEKYLQIRKYFLEELANMNLVEVQEDILSREGTYKSCRLQELVRDFCISKGLDEEFIEIVDFENGKKLGPNTRRVAVYVSKYRADKFIQFSSHDTVKKMRSLLIFDSFESEKSPRWPSEINDLKDFTSLIILSFEKSDFRIRRYPKGIEKLRLLRYLSFQGCWLEELPSSLSKLINLETLDLLVHSNCQMYIPSHILVNMKALVHLYLPRKYVSDEKTKTQLQDSLLLAAIVIEITIQLKGGGKTKLQLQYLENLETLVNFDTEVCDITCLPQLNKLKIFSTISNGQRKELNYVLEHFVENKESRLQQLSVDLRNFDRYNKKCVNIFKKLLECPLLHSIRTKGPIGKLTVEGKPAENIAEMVLNGSELEHDAMPVLARFRNLRSLVLKNDAFLIKEIVISSRTKFSKLRSLKFRKLQYVEKLRIEEGALPQLSRLEIDRCRRLVDASIPEELHNRLRKARVKNVGAYLVMPVPKQFSITTSQCKVASTSSYTPEITESAP